MLQQIDTQLFTLTPAASQAVNIYQLKAALRVTLQAAVASANFGMALD